MQTKYKIIISVFVILGILYVLQFAVSFIANEKKKESNQKSFEERFEGGDVYMDVLRASEDYFMRNKSMSIDVKAQALDELATDSKIKELSGLPYAELERRVIQHINKIAKSDKYQDKESVEKYVDADISSIVEKTDKILTDLASLKIDLQVLKDKSIGTANTKSTTDVSSDKPVAPKPKNKTEEKDDAEKDVEVESKAKKPVAAPAAPAVEKQNKPMKETFVDFDGVYGFENMRAFAAY